MISMKSMKSLNQGYCSNFSESFFGTATIGERGQIVIPAEARAELDMHPGEKVLIMRHPVHPGLTLFKLEAVREFLDEFAAGIARIEDSKEKKEMTKEEGQE